MASATQLNGSTSLHSFNEVVAEDECGFEIFEPQDVISNTREDPVIVATGKLDWDNFLVWLARLNSRSWSSCAPAIASGAWRSWW